MEVALKAVVKVHIIAADTIIAIGGISKSGNLSKCGKNLWMTLPKSIIMHPCNKSQ
jgi:hypothetical protein